MSTMQQENTDATAVRPVSLRFEHHRDALGIGRARPRISFKFEGTEPNWMQAGYELEITRSKGICLSAPETYKIHSPDSVLVPWPGSPLSSGEAASVRVRAFPVHSQASFTPWSEAANVEAGLLHPEDWTCSLIQSPSPTQREPNKPHDTVMFCRSFQTTLSEIHTARLYITSHGVYKAEINGVNVGDHVLAPGWTSYQHELQYQTFDLTQYLKHNDTNVLGVLVGEGWYAGRIGFLGGQYNIWGDKLGVIAQLNITYADGTSTSIRTDDAWMCHHGGAVVQSTIYDGEYYDARLHLAGWSTPDYNTSGADGWQKVDAVRPDVALLQAPDGPPIRRIQELQAVGAWESPSGKWIIDFGQNLVGWVKVHMGTRPKGHTIRLTHTEVLEHGEVATRPLRQAKATDTLVWNGNDPMHWEPHFTFHGFRYVQIEQWSSPDNESQTAAAINNASFDITSFTAVVIHSDMARTGWFECSEPLLNRLHENVVWSMRGNFVGVPTDCPQRDERLGWTGDLQAFATAACYLYDVNGVLRSWLRGVGAEQAEGEKGDASLGVPPLFSPNVFRGKPRMPIAIWGDSVVMVPWDLYQSSGDVHFLQDQYAGMKDWLDKGVVRDEAGGSSRHGCLLWDGNKTVQLGDWLDPEAPPSEPGNGRTDNVLVANAFLVRTTDLMAEIAAVLGHESDAHQYREDAAALRRAFADEYVTQRGRVVSDSQTALALALYFSLLATPAQEARAAARLVHLILSKTRFKIATGFAGTPILGLALTKMDHTQIFYRMLLHRKCPSWLYPVTMGATTVWERWDSMLPDGTVNPGEMTSFNHYATGSVVHWMHTVIGGLQPLVPGWKRFVMRPIPGGTITHAQQRFESPFGRIEAKWELVDGNTRLHVWLTVPPNTTARIQLPGQEEQREVGCGIHEIDVPYTAPPWPVLPIYAPYAPHDDDEP
ncbi:hypothetical protein SEUCBS140593_004522 [Sporothrix eucalyptigena]|uniref:alpha-L-rhamnosidase n=1 Tax=Sporothrix eucalyptigena TaxID=1812306 RepID=A0ABP0BNS7_9PEZI